jgi:hypothetical protein
MPAAALSPPALAALIRQFWPAGRVPQTGESIHVTAYAVARAESGGRPGAEGDLDLGVSIGLWQINLRWHPEYSRRWLYDPGNNARAAVLISNGGRTWNPWCTWERTACGGAGGNQYRAYLPEARAAFAVAPPPPAPPPPRPVPPPAPPPPAPPPPAPPPPAPPPPPPPDPDPPMPWPVPPPALPWAPWAALGAGLLLLYAADRGKATLGPAGGAPAQASRKA